MRKADVIVGELYAVKVSGQFTIARARRVEEGRTGWVLVTNLRTGRDLGLHSARRLRPVEREALEPDGEREALFAQVDGARRYIGRLHLDTHLELF